MIERKELPAPTDLPQIIDEIETGKASVVQIAAFVTALYMMARGVR